jgi:hypothetical protein
MSEYLSHQPSKLRLIRPTAERRKGRKEKDCHFERREKSFVDPAHSLGMTGFGLSLGALGVLARRISESEFPRSLRKP